MEQAPANQGPRPQDVYFFATCVIDQFMPEAGMDAITLLEQEGLRVHFPENQTCCGQPAYTSGFTRQAKAVARPQLDLFPEPWPVIVPSGSCAGMMKHHYVKLFAEEPESLAKAEALAPRVYELTEFLATVLNWQPKGQGRGSKVVLHTSCSARREMGSHLSSRALLERLGNVEVRQQAHEAECCGFGGTFALRQPDISTAMVEDKVADLKASGAERLVSADCGCLLNIMGHIEHGDRQVGRGQSSLPGEHIASFLLRESKGGKA